MKKSFIFLLIIVLITPVPVINLFSTLDKDKVTKNPVDNGVALLEAYDYYDVKTIEKKVNENVNKIAKEKEIKKVLEDIDSGKTTYRNLFKNTYIAGDSLMNGLESYNILNPNNLTTRVSASLYHLSENSNKIIRANPRVLILHYGLNMLGTKEKNLNFFISFYTEILEKFKDEIPDTRIIVSGIFPVDTSVATASNFKNIDKYNDALIKMCEELGVEFMDSSEVLLAHSECYGYDGIHLSRKFYSDYWLRFVVENKGSVG